MDAQYFIEGEVIFVKATGVIRKIDDLGRIVIPKEIRNNLKIRNGESIEIFIDNLDQIILKKYSLDDDYKVMLASYISTIYDASNHNVFITDKHKILSTNNEIKKDYENYEISNDLIKYIDNIKPTMSVQKKNIQIKNNNNINCFYIIKPIIASGECMGLIVMFDEFEELSATDELLTNIASKFLGKYLES